MGQNIYNLTQVHDPVERQRPVDSGNKKTGFSQAEVMSAESR